MALMKKLYFIPLYWHKIFSQQRFSFIILFRISKSNRSWYQSIQLEKLFWVIYDKLCIRDVRQNVRVARQTPILQNYKDAERYDEHHWYASNEKAHNGQGNVKKGVTTAKVFIKNAYLNIVCQRYRYTQMNLSFNNIFFCF